MTTISITQASTRSKVDMPGTVANKTLPFHPRPHPSRKVRVAADLTDSGIPTSEATADKYLHGQRAANLIVAAIIQSDLRAGDTESVAITMAPIYAAEEGADILPLAEALAAYDAADVAEDEAELAINRRCIELLSDAEIEEHKRKAAKEAYAALRCVASYAKVQRDRKAAAR